MGLLNRLIHLLYLLSPRHHQNAISTGLLLAVSSSVPSLHSNASLVPGLAKPEVMDVDRPVIVHCIFKIRNGARF